MSILVPSSLPSGTWSNGNSNYVFYQRLQISRSGILQQFAIYSNVGNSTKIGVYSDIAGPSPGNLLVSDNTGISTSIGWNYLDLPNYSLTIGDWIWLASLNIATGVATRDVGQSSTSYYENMLYSSGLPATATPDGSVGYLFSFAGFGISPALGLTMANWG